MKLGSEREAALHERVAEQIHLEAKRSVDSLYQFIDPAIRESRAAEYDFEPEHTITQIREYTARIESAELVKFTVDGYTEDGGAERGNAPTAIVLASVSYNDGVLKEYRTPWVYRDGQWYTRAIGKTLPFSAP